MLKWQQRSPQYCGSAVATPTLPLVLTFASAKGKDKLMVDRLGPTRRTETAATVISLDTLPWNIYRNYI